MCHEPRLRHGPLADWAGAVRDGRHRHAVAGGARGSGFGVFLLLTALVGVSQWLFVVAGACPVSLVLTRVFGLRSTTKEVAR